jgi:hypothetical protein
MDTATQIHTAHETFMTIDCNYRQRAFECFRERSTNLITKPYHFHKLTFSPKTSKKYGTMCLIVLLAGIDFGHSQYEKKTQDASTAIDTSFASAPNSQFDDNTQQYTSEATEPTEPSFASWPYSQFDFNTHQDTSQAMEAGVASVANNPNQPIPINSLMQDIENGKVPGSYGPDGSFNVAPGTSFVGGCFPAC